MTDAQATVVRKRGINPVWLVPIVAVALGVWMVIYTIQSQGPTIIITFETAEGLEEGKTKIKLLDVEVGLVEDVRIGDDLEHVVVTAQLEPEAEVLLREDTQFWVVRPRIGKGGVSGLGTLLSGGFIQISPGTGPLGAERFVGLEEPPVTPAGTPGVRVVVTAENASSISPGDPVLHRGYEVGRVETETFDLDDELMRYDVFIDAPYDKELTHRHRFWEVSGIAAKVGADGIQVDTGSLETVLFGGVAIGLPEGIEPGVPVQPGEVFRLYENYDAVNEQPHRFSTEYVVRFAQSIRGLLPGAPVEYRGVRIGQVERIMLSELAATDDQPGQAIPVLIRLEPARIEGPDTAAGVEDLRRTVSRGVPLGLRGSLATGNLLTGALYVSFDYYDGVEPAELGTFAGRETIPTIPSGLEGVVAKLTLLLDRLNQLPLDDTVGGVNDVLASVNSLVSSQGMQELPASLDSALAELRTTMASMSSEGELQARLLPTISELERTLVSLRLMLNTLEQQPNSLIFDRKHGEDPRPPVGPQ